MIRQRPRVWWLMIACLLGALVTPMASANEGVINQAVNNQAVNPNTVQGVWTLKAPLPTGRDRLAVVGDGSRIWAIGGESRSGTDYVVSNVVEIYDPNSDSWSTGASLPTAARDLSGCAMNGKIYVPNGQGGTYQTPTFLATLWIYTISTNSWSVGANYPGSPVPVLQAVACDAANNLVYVAGGVSGTSTSTAISNKAYVYNATTNVWTALANLPASRYGAVGFFANGLFLVVGGDTNNTAPALNTVFAYNPGSNTWSTQAAAMTTDRNLAAGAVAGNRLLTLGGGFASTGSVLSSVDSFDGAQWGAWPALNVPRRLLGAGTAAGMVCAIGGFDAYRAGATCDADSGLCQANECYAFNQSFAVQSTTPTASTCGAGDATYQLNLQGINGYTGSVTLSALNLPAGVTAQFSPNPVVVPGNSQLTLSVSGAVAPDSYTITVQGDDGSSTQTTTVALLVVSAAPATTTLSAPANNAVNVPLNVSMSWTAVTNATTYDLQVAEDRNFTALVVNPNGQYGTSWAVSPLLHTSRVLHWRARAVNACGASDWTSANRFSTVGGPDPNGSCRLSDVNCSGGLIDVMDIALTAQAWLDQTTLGYFEADFDQNHDSVVSIADVQIVAAAWGQ